MITLSDRLIITVVRKSILPNSKTFQGHSLATDPSGLATSQASLRFGQHLRRRKGL